MAKRFDAGRITGYLVARMASRGALPTPHGTLSRALYDK
jgi:hypothetical protein